MPVTPDRHPGPLQEDEELELATNPVGPSAPGAMNFDGTSFVMRDVLGNFNPRSGGSLPTPTAEGQHLIATTASAFVIAFPLVTQTDGWLLNEDDLLLVVG